MREVLGDAVTVVRPSYMLGPGDTTGRFTYWVERIATGGTVLAPEPKDQLVQVIDVRDLGRWIVHAAETGVAGAVNANGTPAVDTMESTLTRMTGILSRRRRAIVACQALIRPPRAPRRRRRVWLPGLQAPATAD